ncbi:MAG: transcriptional regulator [Spirochaetes bacterium DG_61]|jgi:UDP-2-acetamido-2-deoxy-ribo-hexuluronate aminotransferase|nr:MAG: transcriptional regulator [Spirochaetes bacterium DG_61]
MKIPFLDLTRQYSSIKDEIDSGIDRVVKSGVYIGGEEVNSLEKEIAQYCDTRFGISISSGTDALLASLMAIGIGRDDEVITSPFSFISTAEVILLLGAKPVFVDIEEDTFNINPDLIEQKISKKTKCIIPVHLFGQMADIHRIMKITDQHHLAVIEDAAQAIGASTNGRKAGSIGEAGCFSFFPSKNLGAFGDGGMVVTNNEEVAEKIALIKNHGSARRYHHSLLGFNGRLDAIQAAVLRVKLVHLEGWADRRRENARFYNESLMRCVKVPAISAGIHHVFNQYSILTDRRDELGTYLHSRGISTAIYYPIPLHLQEVFRPLGYREGDFPVAEEVSRKVLSLPIFPELSVEERRYISQEVLAFFGDGDGTG